MPPQIHILAKRNVVHPLLSHPSQWDDIPIEQVLENAIEQVLESITLGLLASVLSLGIALFFHT